MSLYNDILNEIQGFEESHTPISNIAHQKDFTIMECEKSDDPTDEYECFHAEKTDGSQKIVITIRTRDKYRSFGNDVEPYRNTVILYDNGKKIASESYTYFE